MSYEEPATAGGDQGGEQDPNPPEADELVMYEQAEEIETEDVPEMGSGGESSYG
jgi:hypothetical protein